MDGFEIKSGNPREMRHNIFDWTNNGQMLTSDMYDSGFDTSAAWHTYGFLYDETGVTFYIDGQPACAKGQVQQGGKLNHPAASRPGDWMNVWLTSVLFDAPLAGGSTPGEVLFDCFSFFEKARYIDNDEPSSGTYTESGPGWGKSGLSGFAKSTSRYSCGPGVQHHPRPEGHPDRLEADRRHLHTRCG
ncbi:family 16 glycosylhydrolase [Streptomyces sp. NPDC008343]|uniref:family 16 glycosylhydrolase n=1 Tax=Streptomyces sp. NPDC008343 TaxID=3364828 RepID=UPI0036E82F16